MFGEERLAEIGQSTLDMPAIEIQKTLLSKITEFVGEEPQYDDLTIVILQREETA
jgi:serine phosphatase RsbU (regulator of sigma subunit)